MNDNDTPSPDIPQATSLTPEHNHAVIGITIHPAHAPAFVYSLPALVERETFANPSTSDPHTAVWAMVTDIINTHGEAAPVFVDDAAAREARSKTVIVPGGRKIICP